MLQAGPAGRSWCITKGSQRRNVITLLIRVDTNVPGNIISGGILRLAVLQPKKDCGKRAKLQIRVQTAPPAAGSAAGSAAGPVAAVAEAVYRWTTRFESPRLCRYHRRYGTHRHLSATDSSLVVRHGSSSKRARGKQCYYYVLYVLLY